MERFSTEYKFYASDELSDIEEIKEKKKPLITFAKLNRYFLIIFFCPVFGMLGNLFLSKTIRTRIVGKLEFVFSVYNCLAFLLAGLFHFISYFRVNLKKNNSSIFEKEINNLGNIKKYNQDIFNKCDIFKIIVFIILLSLIIVIRSLLFNYFYQNHIFEKRLFYFFFVPLFSKLILKENIYKHQYFSLIIAIIGTIFVLIPICLVIKKEDYIPNIWNLINGILYSLFLVIINYLVEKYYMSPLKISLIIGIISLFVNCFGYIIYSLVKYNDLSYFEDCINLSRAENKLELSIYIVLTILFTIIFQLLTLLALFYFSPSLVIITDAINPLLVWIQTIINSSGEIPDDVLYPIGYVIIIFSALIYNEIIIFNFCGLNKNTKKYVNERINIEMEKIQKNMDDIESNEDEEDKKS